MITKLFLEKRHSSNVFKAKCQQKQHAAVTIVLELATLGSTTEIGSFLLFVMPSKVAKASTVMCCFAGVNALKFANGNTA